MQRGIGMANRFDNSLASPCGLYCGECLRYGELCKGCVPSGGRPSWGGGRLCPIFACVAQKKVEHCGKCTDFPCNRFLRQFDPRHGRWRVFYKAGQLLYRTKIGTSAWIREKAKGRNPDPRVSVERCLEWEASHSKEPHQKRAKRVTR